MSVLCFEIGLSPSISKQNTYYSNLSLYFRLPWASVRQYTVRATAILTFRGFFPRGLYRMGILSFGILSYNISRDFYVQGILFSLVLILGDFVVGDFYPRGFCLKIISSLGVMSQGISSWGILSQILMINFILS